MGYLIYFTVYIIRQWSLRRIKTSVADPGCLSRIPDPDFYPSRIPDPKTATKERGEKKNLLSYRTFLCNHKFHKIENYFSFEVLKKKIWADSQRFLELFPKKLSQTSQKYGFGIRDPGSGKNLSRIQGSGSATLIKTCYFHI